MAQPSRDDEALTAGGRPIACRRWVLILASVLMPIALGALATLVLYATRSNPVAAPTESAAGSDVKGFDGPVLVLQLRSTAPVRLPVGLAVEVVLQPGLGEAVVSENPAILVATSNPTCHLSSLCGMPGAQRWTFRAIHAGVAYLKISFGFHVCRPNAECTITALVLKPIAVYSRPQAS